MRKQRPDGTYEKPLQLSFHKVITNKKGRLLKVEHFDTVSTKAFQELMKVTGENVRIPVPIDGLMVDVVNALKSRSAEKQAAAREFLAELEHAMLHYAIKGNI